MTNEAGNEEQFEKALRAGLHGLEPPAGLKERLQTAVHEYARSTSLSDFAKEGIARPLETATSQIIVSGNTHPDRESVSVDGQANFTSRRNALVAAVTACIVLVAVGLWWNSSPSKEQIVALCLDQAQASEELTEWSKSQSLPPELNTTIRRNSSLLKEIRTYSSRTIDAGRLGSKAEIWRLSGSRGEFFVMTLTSSKKIDGLSSALAIVQTGTWSVAAMQLDDQIVIIASVENLAEFIQRQTA